MSAAKLFTHTERELDRAIAALAFQQESGWSHEAHTGTDAGVDDRGAERGFQSDHLRTPSAGRGALPRVVAEPGARETGAFAERVSALPVDPFATSRGDCHTRHRSSLESGVRVLLARRTRAQGGRGETHHSGAGGRQATAVPERWRRSGL